VVALEALVVLVAALVVEYQLMMTTESSAHKVVAQAVQQVLLAKAQLVLLETLVQCLVAVLVQVYLNHLVAVVVMVIQVMEIAQTMLDLQLMGHPMVLDAVLALHKGQQEQQLMGLF
jgi:hypothetical protein